MEVVRAFISNKKLESEAAEKKFRYVQQYNAGFDQVWLHYDQFPPVQDRGTNVTVFLGKISAHFILRFRSYQSAVRFLSELNITNFSGNSQELFFLLYYGNKEGRRNDRNLQSS